MTHNMAGQNFIRLLRLFPWNDHSVEYSWAEKRFRQVPAALKALIRKQRDKAFAKRIAHQNEGL